MGDPFLFLSQKKKQKNLFGDVFGKFLVKTVTIQDYSSSI